MLTTYMGHQVRKEHVEKISYLKIEYLHTKNELSAETTILYSSEVRWYYFHVSTYNVDNLHGSEMHARLCSVFVGLRV